MLLTSNIDFYGWETNLDWILWEGRAKDAAQYGWQDTGRDSQGFHDDYRKTKQGLIAEDRPQCAIRGDVRKAKRGDGAGIEHSIEVRANWKRVCGAIGIEHIAHTNIEIDIDIDTQR